MIPVETRTGQGAKKPLFRVTDSGSPHAPADDDAPIFLIGFMASGKTTVGRLLAERLELGVRRPGQGHRGRRPGRRSRRSSRRRGRRASGRGRRRRCARSRSGGRRSSRRAGARRAGRRTSQAMLETRTRDLAGSVGRGSGRPRREGVRAPAAGWRRRPGRGGARGCSSARRAFYARAHAKRATPTGATRPRLCRTFCCMSYGVGERTAGYRSR